MPHASKICVAYYKLRARRPEYQALLRATKGFLRARLDGACYVSFSAGKDSSVCAHLCNELKPGIPLFLVEPPGQTLWLNEERQAWLGYAETNGWSLKLFSWDRWRKKMDTQHLQELHLDQFSEVTAYADAHGLTTRVMGLREGESNNRRMTIRDLGMDYDYVNGQRRLLPVAKWTTDDIWTYIVASGMPWLSIYDVAGPDARNGLIGLNAHEKGRLAYLKAYYPRVWEEAKQYLGVNNA